MGLTIGQFLALRLKSPDTVADPYNVQKESFLELNLPEVPFVSLGGTQLPPPPMVVLTGPAKLPMSPDVTLSSPAALPQPPSVSLSSPAQYPFEPAPPATGPADLPQPPAVQLSTRSQLPQPPAFSQVGPSSLPLPPAVQLSSPAQLPAIPSVQLSTATQLPQPPTVGKSISDSLPEPLPFKTGKHEPDPAKLDTKFVYPGRFVPPPGPQVHQAVPVPSKTVEQPVPNVNSGYKLLPQTYSPLGGGPMGSHKMDPVLWERSVERLTRGDMPGKTLLFSLEQLALFAGNSNGNVWNPLMINPDPFLQSTEMTPAFDTVKTSDSFEFLNDPAAKFSFSDGIIPVKLFNDNQFSLRFLNSDLSQDDDQDYFPLSFTDLRKDNNGAGYRSVAFRALDLKVAESFAPSWNKQNYFGRVDPVMTYQSTERSFSVSFSIVAFDPLDLSSIYQKLHWLTSMVYPQYDVNLSYKSGPVVRLRVGDVINSEGNSFLKGLPGVIESLDFDYNETEWELKKGMKLPRRVAVSLRFTVLHDSPMGMLDVGQSMFGGIFRTVSSGNTFIGINPNLSRKFAEQQPAESNVAQINSPAIGIPDPPAVTEQAQINAGKPKTAKSFVASKGAALSGNRTINSYIPPPAPVTQITPLKQLYPDYTTSTQSDWTVPKGK